MPNLPSPLNDASEKQWSAFREALRDRKLPWSLPKEATDALKSAFVLSSFVHRTAVRRPAMTVDLAAGGDLMRPYTIDDYTLRCGRYLRNQAESAIPSGEGGQERHPPSEADIQMRLRLFRQREMIRIAIRDLAGLADLNATLLDLSNLADTCIGQALDYLHKHLCLTWGTPMDTGGRPQDLVVLGMGKLGARELNFSSDVDLIFAYPGDGHTQNGTHTTSNEDFFIRLSRKLIQTIGAATEEGIVFRVDTRLRPFGESGPLALSFDRMEEYYQVHGREWERYALIKARLVTGAPDAGNRLLDALKPFVYRRYLDYNTFDSLRDMKQRIAVEVRGKGLQDNIKLGPGGIREVEFFGQMFQLLRGGVQPELQVRDIQTVLKYLATYRYIPPATASDLTQAYVFLRRTENRIQEFTDEQRHNLPTGHEERLRLAAAMGFSHWEAFEQALAYHRHRVHQHFNALLAGGESGRPPTGADQSHIEELEAVWQNVLDAARARTILAKTGFSDPSRALGLIADLREDGALRPMSAMGRQRLSRIMPRLLEAAGAVEHPQQVLLRLFALIKSICRRTVYLSLLCEYPQTLAHLVRLFEASSWIADLLNRHPVLLDELLDPRTLYRPPTREALVAELRSRLSGVPAEDLEHQLEALCIFKQTNVLRVAASDITHVLPLMKVSDHLSDIAEVVINAVVALSWGHLAAKHGTPTCSLEDEPCRQGFAVIAYGKLGGLELGYRSDLDLVFLHAAAAGQTQGGGRAIDNAQFFSRLGQRVLHMLTAHTPAGILYETDMRLRPSGDSGMLVSHIEGFADYQHRHAWTWEHQALIRARAIAGDPCLRRRFKRIRMEVLNQRRDLASLRNDVVAMRHKLDQARTPAADGAFDVKEDRGGMVDIEFLVQFLLLGHSHRHPQITRWTDNVRQLQSLSQFKIIDRQTAFALRRAYLILRATGHRLNLKGMPAHIEKDRFQGITALVERCWKRYLEDD
jgi:[glutamine synthetase] adenylyltransferase / [glutamine synthetase]-adenylyl-L-tyrosine phosphorylase